MIRSAKSSPVTHSHAAGPAALAVAPCVLAALWLSGCGAPPPNKPVKDIEFTQAMGTARTAYDRGQSAQAILLFEQAMRRAESRDDAADIGDAAYNLAICLIDDSQLERAERLLETSRRELIRGGLRTTDVRLVQAKLARRMKVPDKATAIANEVASSTTATAAERCQAMTLLAQIDLEKGQLNSIDQRLRVARAAIAQVPSTQAQTRTALEANIVGIEAGQALARGDSAKAAGLFDRQSILSQQAGLYSDMSAALTAAGRAYVRASDQAAASDRLYRAARSLIAQGDREQGIQVAREAIEVAGKAGLMDVAEAAKDLIDTSPPTTAPTH